ncbi:MAG: GNAT family N-acetyltransferase [Actinomycetota bacterium]
MTTPELQLRTLYVLDDAGRLTATREPGLHRPPAFALIRGTGSCAWGVRDDVAPEVAAELDHIASTEPPNDDLNNPPAHAERYLSLLGGRVESGPAFSFPEMLSEPTDVVEIDHPSQLGPGFADLAEEVDGRAPVMAVLDEGVAVSICHCARRSGEAAEAGLVTLRPHRGRGFGPLVTAAWALAIRASGRIPLYSTSWENTASRAVARKLGLIAYASDWNCGPRSSP